MRKFDDCIKAFVDVHPKSAEHNRDQTVLSAFFKRRRRAREVTPRYLSHRSCRNDNTVSELFP